MRRSTRYRKQYGQSMVEYTVVLVFGVLALTTGPSGDVMQELLQAIKDNYQGYSFGISMSEVPDFDNASDYRAFLKVNKVDDDMIGRLAVNSNDLYTELSPYNKDPNPQLKTLSKVEATKRWFESVDGIKGKLTDLFGALPF